MCVYTGIYVCMFIHVCAFVCLCVFQPEHIEKKKKKKKETSSLKHVVAHYRIINVKFLQVDRMP